MHRGMSKEWPGGWAVHLEQPEGTHKERNGKKWAVPLLFSPLFILLYTLFPMPVQVKDLVGVRTKKQTKEILDSDRKTRSQTTGSTMTLRNRNK